MASIATTDSRQRRSFDFALPLVPFIDFLLCLIAFLLVTAVWAHASRLEADASMGGAPGPTTEPPPILHVTLRERDFELAWRQGSTLLDVERVPRENRTAPDGSLQFPELGAAIERQWRERGKHRAGNERASDRAVLHTSNTAPFAEVVATLDQLRAPTRVVRGAKGASRVPAFSVSFASD